jgi:YVTN family beta-propeller protein
MSGGPCTRLAGAAGLLGCLALGGFLSSADAPALSKRDLPSHLRRPVALALVEDDRWLVVANQRSGSVTVLDTVGLRPAAEATVGRRLTDLVAMSSGRLLAVDEGADELLILDRHGPTIDVASRVKVAPAPVSVQVDADGKHCFVASLWSRLLSVVCLDPAPPHVERTIALPFAPRRQLLLADTGELVVTDAFGGRLALIDVRRGAVESVRTVPAHNIRGLVRSPDGNRLLLTHQLLSTRASSKFDDIHWGNLLTNNVRELALKDVTDPKADLLRDGYLHYLGTADRGAGDPTGLTVCGDQLLVTLAGVDELAIGPRSDGDWRRLAVGRRPTAVVAGPNGRRAYVANTFGDSISVVDLKKDRVEATVSLGPTPELTRGDHGELLFHDARLSLEGWFSCQSCHTDGHTNGLLNDNLTDGSLGTPKRILSLLGVGDTGPWAWNGRMPDLESQVRQSVQSTMQGAKPTDEQVRNLAAYVRTLGSPPSLARLRGEVDEEAVRRGREVFHRHGCEGCHAPPTYTSPRTYNVGLPDEAGNTMFNPPSLRGVSQGGPYFHNNSAATLEEVFTRSRHQLKGELAKADLDDLLAFLRSL